MSLLFLNNNLHLTHHERPGVPWYRLPGGTAALDGDAQAAAGAGLYAGYVDVARRYLFRPLDAAVVTPPRRRLTSTHGPPCRRLRRPTQPAPQHDRPERRRRSDRASSVGAAAAGGAASDPHDRRAERCRRSRRAASSATPRSRAPRRLASSTRLACRPSSRRCTDAPHERRPAHKRVAWGDQAAERSLAAGGR